MRILLFLYVVVILLLNFLFDIELIFFFAISTFPVSLYLLLTKPKVRSPKKPQNPAKTEPSSTQKQNSY